MSLSIVGGRALLPGEGIVPADVHASGDVISAENPGGRTIDARGLLALPGIVDLHGDAFERQVQPRPGVSFPMGLALADTEAQLLANGVTTAFHGVTLSWEPGLRGATAWTALLDALDAHRPRAACDMRVHLRWEAFNVDAIDLALDAVARGRVHLLAFNDHTPTIVQRLDDAAATAKLVERACVRPEAFRAAALAAAGRAADVEPARRRLADAARSAGLPMASHDDASPEERGAFRALGARICEFPITEATARAAVEAGDAVAMGGPNVVRGGSHLGWASAARMAEAGLCGVLVSDYFYPALLRAPFALAARGAMDLSAAWALVSANSARAAGLRDRGELVPGARADVVLVAPEPEPRVVATIAGGRVAHLSAEGFERLG
jgi:alpha-D-ribose 1-methylphosphonate 5-triphosphate diphosphatase